MSDKGSNINNTSENNVNKLDKSFLPSRHTTVGAERAPHRSFLYAMGLSQKEISQPFVGVVTTWNEAAPCNISLSRQAQAALSRAPTLVFCGASGGDSGPKCTAIPLECHGWAP